jgi:hypothetical protein
VNVHQVQLSTWERSAIGSAQGSSCIVHISGAQGGERRVKRPLLPDGKAGQTFPISARAVKSADDAQMRRDVDGRIHPAGMRMRQALAILLYMLGVSARRQSCLERARHRSAYPFCPGTEGGGVVEPAGTGRLSSS